MFTSKTILFLFLILILAASLRFYNFTDSLDITSDQAIAFLKAKRMIFNGHYPLLGPFTSLSGVNITPPTYFYLFTFIYLFVRNEISVTLFFTLAGLLSVSLIFLMASELFKKKLRF